MEAQKVKLIERIKRTPTVESFRFLAEKKINFLPGQFLQLIFDPGNPDNRELNKYLSFSASPAREYIEVTKRLSDSQFSARLKNLRIEDEVYLKGPLGGCVFKEEYQRVAFLIGGIGITPVIAIMEYIVEKKLNNDAILLYSNRSEDEIAFKKELDYWQANHANLKIIYVVTDCRPKDNRCIFGRIDKNLFLERIDAIAERQFFIFGPPKMVEVMQDVCLNAGGRRENIKTENFIGY